MIKLVIKLVIWLVKQETFECNDSCLLQKVSREEIIGIIEIEMWQSICWHLHLVHLSIFFSLDVVV